MQNISINCMESSTDLLAFLLLLKTPEFIFHVVLEKTLYFFHSNSVNIILPRFFLYIKAFWSTHYFPINQSRSGRFLRRWNGFWFWLWEHFDRCLYLDITTAFFSCCVVSLLSFFRESRWWRGVMSSQKEKITWLSYDFTGNSQVSGFSCLFVCLVCLVWFGLAGFCCFFFFF